MTAPPCILVTGGCGYIGSHTITILLNSPLKYSVVVVDNLVNSSSLSLDRVADICNLDAEERKTRLIFYETDLCDADSMKKVFEDQKARGAPFAGCIHFAGLKAVGESSRLPLMYYENNIMGTLILLKLMEEYECRSIVFSSSATVYGAADKMPITEKTSVGTGITNAYGRTKYMIEEILGDFSRSHSIIGAKDWSITILRYFNPVGAHPTGKIGEDPDGPPNNLMPYVSQVAVGRREFLTVFGNDYDTPDGTGVRDYIHVMDLAEAHMSALNYMDKKGSGLHVFNIGTGNGYSVLEMVAAMQKASGREIKYKVGDRRPGDISTCYADASLAKEEMGWEAKLGLDEMCRDLWCWQSNNPQGYATKNI
uniref:UDP-glucose 4-epimerase n=1 Tax=Leptocylindrus danicus TaxID=163516 RepID=A0A7S2K478_9STRA|mmetsp:Transcript_17462/g.26007  ORF Transcript_17462/g.26007 Transcript_17462/m.26007 type:complete len:367 (+) Transcript_17462:111-1211(+)|eukprot:CAMPEP_0116010500 /NCGR_PEP_ID=MMETSP0321-20121206/4035_1 /TAXON_ID=163516 /ORGANISM="Leptocylindrus danicus var. danicus, Strain B650" /LENGTH=366 /DNA_ID=CAMNT_0003479605 /DNA_START=15 /DNA_END=1115 /DNA_ORIENTATION=-